MAWYYWPVGAALLSAYALLLFRYPVATTAITAILAVSGYVGRRSVKRSLGKVARDRPGDSICTFARSFDHDTDTWVIRAVYEELQAQLSDVDPHFPLRPSDDLVKDLRLDGDDIDMDLAPAIAQRTGRSLDAAKQNPYYGRVKTVADLVCFFCGQSKNAA